MAADPKVSVIVPVFNREFLIERSINSVLNQTYKNIEVIVIDDASTDSTFQIVSSIKDDRLKCIKNVNNLGPSKSRNIGTKMASGELIAFQDSDDEWKSDKLEKQVNILLRSEPNIAAVYCKMQFIDFDTGKSIGEDSIAGVDFQKIFTSHTHFLTPANVTVLIKKKVLQEVGFFDESLHAMEDTELAIRVSKKYKYAFIDEPLVIVRRNHDQLTSNPKNYAAAKEIIYEKHKDYLNNRLLFDMCKEIANYHILTGNYQKAKLFLKKSFKHRVNLKTSFQFILIKFFPALIKFLYGRKYSMGIPHPNKEGEFVKHNSN